MQLTQLNRVIGDLGGSDGPVVVFIGGVHGNEPSGVLALQQVFQDLNENNIPLHGRVMGLAGNLQALAEKKRFISKDLNRIWNNAFLARYQSDANQNTDDRGDDSVAEYHEQDELFKIIEPLLKLNVPLYFLDLHTTSSPSAPFMAINDQLDNRNFALQFPIRTVLGIEEYLEGPLLSYLNDFGCVALAFEAGQHDAPESVDIHIAFIYMALVAAGVIDRDDLPNHPTYRKRLRTEERSDQVFFEVIYRKEIEAEDGFQMKAGFANFDPISKGEPLANGRQGAIAALRSGQIFMPLYQDSGAEGFFIVRRVPKWALRLSSLLRKINFERVLTWLPGVSRSGEYPDALVVNKKIAFLLATELFHLLGYRRKKADGDRLIFLKREIVPRDSWNR